MATVGAPAATHRSRYAGPLAASRREIPTALLFPTAPLSAPQQPIHSQTSTNGTARTAAEARVPRSPLLGTHAELGVVTVAS
jgi:hypothetical protein